MANVNIVTDQEVHTQMSADGWTYPKIDPKEKDAVKKAAFKKEKDDYSTEFYLLKSKMQQQNVIIPPPASPTTTTPPPVVSGPLKRFELLMSGHAGKYVTDVQETFVEGMISLEDLHATSFKELLGAMGYSGFQPGVTYSALRDIYGDIEELSEDVLTVCIFGLLNGTSFKRVRGSQMGDVGLKRMLEIELRMKIEFPGKGVKEKGSVITLGRVLSTFPHYTYSLILEEPSLVRIRVDPADCPLALQFPAAPAIIPKSRDDLFEKWKVWSLIFQDTIKPVVPVTDAVTIKRIAQAQENIVRAMHDSPFFPEAYRIDLMLRGNL
jgi:hypothetical protein